MTNYRVEYARIEHLPFLQEIELAAAKQFPAALLPADLAGDTVSTDVLFAGLRNELLWVAVGPDETPVGFILMVGIQQLALIKEMDVHPHYQQRGLGRALLNTALDEVQKRGFERAGLTTFATVPWNAPFYRRQGFVMPDKAATPAVLRGILKNERNAGLANRVAMIKEFEPGPR